MKARKIILLLFFLTTTTTTHGFTIDEESDLKVLYLEFMKSYLDSSYNCAENSQGKEYYDLLGEECMRCDIESNTREKYHFCSTQTFMKNQKPTEEESTGNGSTTALIIFVVILVLWNGGFSIYVWLTNRKLSRGGKANDEENPLISVENKIAVAISECKQDIDQITEEKIVTAISECKQDLYESTDEKIAGAIYECKQDIDESMKDINERIGQNESDINNRTVLGDDSLDAIKKSVKENVKTNDQRMKDIDKRIDEAISECKKDVDEKINKCIEDNENIKTAIMDRVNNNTEIIVENKKNSKQRMTDIEERLEHIDALDFENCVKEIGELIEGTNAPNNKLSLELKNLPESAELEKVVDKYIDECKKEINGNMKDITERFDEHVENNDQRMKDIGSRIDSCNEGINDRVKDINERIDQCIDDIKTSARDNESNKNVIMECMNNTNGRIDENTKKEEQRMKDHEERTKKIENYLENNENNTRGSDTVVEQKSEDLNDIEGKSNKPSTIARKQQRRTRR